MGIFNKNKGFDTRSQKEWTMEQLMAGKKLTQIDMLMDFGIGHHCEVIRRCRKELEAKGLPYDYIHTEMIELRSKRTGRLIRFAQYSIPEKVAENE